MSNICNNTFYAYSEDEKNIDIIVKFFEDVYDEDCEVNNNNIDVYFDSNWEFPEEEMNTLFNLIPNKEDIYMRCLSVEYGNLYHALWICDKNGWREI